MQLVIDRHGTYETPEASSLSAPSQWLVDALTWGNSSSGLPVTWQSTLSISAAWYCINMISDTIGQTPLDLFIRSAKGVVEEDPKHPGGKLVRRPMAGSLNAFQLKKLLTLHACTSGNGRAFISFNGRSEPDELIPLPCERTKTVVIHDTETSTPQKWHVVFPEDGGTPIPLPDSDVLHIYKTSWDGYNGVSPIDILKNNFGLSLAAEKSASVFYRNNGVPSLALEAPPGVFKNVADAQKFLADWDTRHSGAENQFRTALLREGIKATPLNVNARDAQMAELREFQVREIMRVFGVPVIPGVADSQSYNTLEQLNRAMLLHCFGPWMKVWTEECNRKLLTLRENRVESHFFAFDTWELQKPDATARAEMLSKLKTSMLITTNEAREWEELPPLPGGDVLENPNTTTSKQAPSDPPAKPAETSTEQPATQQRLMAMLLQPLAKVEVARCREMAGKARNFLDWSESFYASHMDRLSEVVIQAGGQPWMATEYIEFSKYQLVQATECKPEELQSRIESVTAAWLDRTSELAATICEGMRT